MSFSPLPIRKIGTELGTRLRWQDTHFCVICPLHLYFPFLPHAVSCICYPTVLMYVFHVLSGLRWDINELTYHYDCWASGQVGGRACLGKNDEAKGWTLSQTHLHVNYFLFTSLTRCFNLEALPVARKRFKWEQMRKRQGWVLSREVLVFAASGAVTLLDAFWGSYFISVYFLL